MNLHRMLLARQAAMRAERRVAEAALEAAKAQLGRTELERQKLNDQLQALGDGSDHIHARDAAEAAKTAAEETMRSKVDQVEFKLAEASLRKALMELKLATKKRRKN